MAHRIPQPTMPIPWRRFARRAALFAVVAGAWACAGDAPASEEAIASEDANVAGEAIASAEVIALGRAIEPSELAARISNNAAPVILDVRTPEEFDSGHIPGAINVPHMELADRLSSLELPLDEEIVVHCEAGGRAGMAEAVLLEAGYTNVRDLTGHMRAWRDGGYPVP